jgi:class 3 adenylate cyclase
MVELPTGTVTFLFTDLEGSTRLWEEHPEAMRAALARHDEILRDAVEQRDGHVVKTTGDGLHAAFALAHDAMAAALDAQRALVTEEWTLPEPLRVRMGLHTGSAEMREGDYFGPAVNRAARVSGAAHGGQIVASATTADLLRDDLAGRHFALGLRCQFLFAWSERAISAPGGQAGGGSVDRLGYPDSRAGFRRQRILRQGVSRGWLRIRHGEL